MARHLVPALFRRRRRTADVRERLRELDVIKDHVASSLRIYGR
jgi:hypothetical protein